MTFWDMPPPGYEGMTVAQVKETGHFPLPGQATKPHAAFAINTLYSASAAADTYTAAFAQTATVAAAATAANPAASVARQARRLYVGSIPPGANEEALMSFFNQTVVSFGIAENGSSPVVAVQINHEKSYAFVEFRTPEEATQSMALDGLQYGGQILKIRRPKDYQPPVAGVAAPPSLVPGVVSTQVLDSPFKLFVGGLPSYLNEEQVMELLKSFGELKAFNLVKDTGTGLSKGFAFCEYMNPIITDIACQGLNGMELGDKKLIVQRASIGANKPAAPVVAFAPSLLTTSFLGGAAPAMGGDPTNILLLLNMVVAEELVDDEEYSEILEDIQEECGKYGSVQRIVIPRPIPDQENPDVGKIFVEFDSVEAASAALKALAGRKFADRTVFTSFVDAETFSALPK